MGTFEGEGDEENLKLEKEHNNKKRKEKEKKKKTLLKKDVAKTRNKISGMILKNQLIDILPYTEF